MHAEACALRATEHRTHSNALWPVTQPAYDPNKMTLCFVQDDPDLLVYALACWIGVTAVVHCHALFQTRDRHTRMTRLVCQSCTSFASALLNGPAS